MIYTTPSEDSILYTLHRLGKIWPLATETYKNVQARHPGVSEHCADLVPHHKQAREQSVAC